MFPIDPANRTPRTETPLQGEGASFDAAAVLLTLAAHQMNLAQSMLAQQATRGLESLGRVGSLGSAALRAAQLRESVLQTELSDVQRTLSELESFPRKFEGGESSPLVLAEADNERLSQWDRWASQRGFELAPMTKTEPVVVESSSSQDARQSPPTPRILIDQASVLGNLDALRGYRQQLQQGIADNPRLQQVVASRPDAAKLADEVRRLGYDGDLTTLSGIEQATAALQQRVELTLKEIAGVTDAVKRLGDEIQAKADQVVQQLQRQTEQHDQVVDRESLEAQLERMEMAAELREAILSAEAELSAALRRFGVPQIDAAELETLTSQLSEPQRIELEQALDAWKTQWEGEFTSVEPPKPLRQSLAAMRREYL